MKMPDKNSVQKKDFIVAVYHGLEGLVQEHEADGYITYTVELQTGSPDLL